LSVAVTVVLVAQVSEQTVPSAFFSERKNCTALDDAVCTLTGEQPGGAPVQQLRAAAACPATPPAAGQEGWRGVQGMHRKGQIEETGEAT